MGFTPSSGTELQAEYFVPRRHAVDAIRVIARIGPRIGPHLLISEIRTIAADDLWMSPCYRQDSLAIHFTWKQDVALTSQTVPRRLARHFFGFVATLPGRRREDDQKLRVLSPGVEGRVDDAAADEYRVAG